jgi:hypothetical protein
MTEPKRFTFLAIMAGLFLATRVMAEAAPTLIRPIVSVDKGEMWIVGDIWSPIGARQEKAIRAHTWIHCRKRLGACALATGNEAGVHAELLTVLSWTSKRVALRHEETHASCTNTDYAVDLTSGDVSLISSPGSLAERIECRTGPYQKPKRIVYELSRFVPRID